MPSDGEQQPSGKPEYKVYKARRGLFSRFRRPDISSLRDMRRGERGSDRGDPGERRPGRRRPGMPSLRGRRWLKYVLAAIGAWIVLSMLVFAFSAQLQSF